MRPIERLMDAMFGTIKAVSDRLEARMAALELRAPVPGPVGPAGPEGPAGQSADPAELAFLKAEIAALRTQIADTKAQPLAAPEPIDIDAIVARVAAAVERPKDGRDGKSVSVDDVAPLIAAEVAKAVAAVPVAKDGVGMSGGLIDRDGNLVVTLTDGTVKNLGPVVGKDGAPGVKGDRGDRGDEGPVGPAGKNGTTVRVGSGEPDGGGASGDVYIDIETGRIYQCA
jgi:hypothetical protein